jgi:hypothetical protein
MKERGRSERAEKAEGVRRGDDKYLYPRDAGPARRLVRDVVDSRRGVGPAFFAGTLVVAVASSGFMPETVRGAATGLWLALILFFLVDSVYLSLRLGRLLRERHPDEARGFVRVRHTFYGIMRSLVFRRIRNPAPAVKLGDSV